MHGEIVCQGRLVGVSEVAWLRGWLEDRRSESRHRLALDLCRHWQWKTATGRWKNYAARSFLLKLERRGLIDLPPVRESMRRTTWLQPARREADAVRQPEGIVASLNELKPLSILIPLPRSAEEVLLRSCLAAHHSLSA